MWIPLIYFTLVCWSSLKIANYLLHLTFYLIMHLLLFLSSDWLTVHAFSVTWLFLLYKFTCFFIFFFSLWRRAKTNKLFVVKTSCKALLSSPSPQNTQSTRNRQSSDYSNSSLGLRNFLSKKKPLRKHKLLLNKRSVLRRQSRDTNRNTKRSVYCQYG